MLEIYVFADIFLEPTPLTNHTTYSHTRMKNHLAPLGKDRHNKKYIASLTEVIYFNLLGETNGGQRTCVKDGVEMMFTLLFIIIIYLIIYQVHSKFLSS